MAKPLNILTLATQIAPLIAEGNLGDVIAGLAGGLAINGNNVKVFIPHFKAFHSDIPGQSLGSPVTVSVNGRDYTSGIIRYVLPNQVEVVALDNQALYGRDGIYTDAATGNDYPDNDLRFAVYCRSALEYCRVYDDLPDIIHAHDWHAAAAVLLVRENRDPLFRRTGTVFTFHSIEFPGVFDRQSLQTFGLPDYLFHPDGIEYYGNISLLKAGIIGADAVATVSDRFKDEIKSPDYGNGLHGLFASLSDKLYGINNGVDYSILNPKEGQDIECIYHSESLGGKKECKDDLLQAFGLPEPPERGPIFAISAELAPEKGLDLVVPVVSNLIDNGGTLVVLGKGDPGIENNLRALSQKHPDRIGVRIERNPDLARKIESGADFLLMPHRFAPTADTQIRALRFGTIPIVHTTGSLDDTVKEYIPKSGRGNGFKFEQATPESLLESITKGIDTFQKPKRWNRIRRNAMSTDFSWEKQASKYVTIYNKILKSIRSKKKY